MCKELVRNVSTFGEMSPECVIQHKYDANEEPFSLNPFKNMMEGPMQGKWLKMYHPTLPGESQGEVEIMITLLPRKQAEERPVGKARELPNRDPELKEPDRAHLSLLNPLGSLALIMGPDMAKKIVFVILILGSLYMFVMSAFFIINDIIDAEITATINEKRAMEQEMEIERENLITGAEAYAKHAIGLNTLEEEVHKKLNETETKILDTTGLSTVLKKYNEVKSEIDHYSNAARDATVSTTVPPTTATATPNTTAATVGLQQPLQRRCLLQQPLQRRCLLQQPLQRRCLLQQPLQRRCLLQQPLQCRRLQAPLPLHRQWQRQTKPL